MAGLGRSAVVVDLACGDGRLLEAMTAEGADLLPLGVDASASELASAQRGTPGARLLRASYDRLPFAAGAVDCVACHMAFMLFGDAPKARDELARVLVPGGTCHLVMGAAGATGLFADHVRAVKKAIADTGSGILPLGDARFRGAGRLATLFGREAGFHLAEPQAWTLTFLGPPPHLWEVLRYTYTVDQLPAWCTPRLEAAFHRTATRYLDEGGNATLQLPLTYLKATRLQAGPGHRTASGPAATP